MISVRPSVCLIVSLKHINTYRLFDRNHSYLVLLFCYHLQLSILYQHFFSSNFTGIMTFGSFVEYCNNAIWWTQLLLDHVTENSHTWLDCFTSCEVDHILLPFDLINLTRYIYLLHNDHNDFLWTQILSVSLTWISYTYKCNLNIYTGVMWVWFFFTFGSTLNFSECKSSDTICQ